MDLADIRKKAKAQKDGLVDKGATARSTPATKDVRNNGKPTSSSVQGVPVVQSSPQKLPTVLPQPPSDDPLEALFNYCPEIDFATEEAYAQGLVAVNEEDVQDIQQWLTFSLGNEEYALDIESISEIIKWRDIEEIPRVPDFILGIISLRGIVVPIFDLRKRLKLGKVEVSPSSRIIICQGSDRMAGLFVDGINQVVKMPVKKIEPAPAILTGLDKELVKGVGRFQDRMIILLNLGNVLDAERV